MSFTADASARTAPDQSRKGSWLARSRHRVTALTASIAVVFAGTMIPGTATADTSVDDQLLAHYPLLAGAQDTVSDHHGEVVGDVSFDPVEGAILPGNSGSSTNYVELPGDLFAGEDALTVSLWIKASTGAGNYAAMFVGTPAASNPSNQSIPEYYWLLNPTDPSGNFKSVVTDHSSPGSP